MNPQLIVTVPRGYDHRATPDLYTLQLVSPEAFNFQGDHYWPGYFWPDEDIFVVNYSFNEPKACYNVRCNGRRISFKRRPEIRFPWAHGSWRSGQGAYGHFVSLDGDTWDQTSDYVPYRILSVLSAAERRAEAREAKASTTKKGAK